MTDENVIPNGVSFPVGSEEWQDYVDAFKEENTQIPNPDPDVATFKLKDGTILNVEKGPELIEKGQPQYTNVPTEGVFNAVWNSLPQNVRQGPVQIFKIIAPEKDNGPEQYEIRMGRLKFRDRPGLTPGEGGVIHNPPSITEQ